MYKLLLVENYNDLSETAFRRLYENLPQERQNRINRYRLIQDKNAAVVSWAMAQYLLKKEFGLAHWSVAYNAYGKPFLKDYPDIHFNISHCKNGCLCAVSDQPIGIDIQDITEFHWNIAEHACCFEELKVLQSAENPAQSFTAMWTIKESILKMTGYGIGAGLKEINSIIYQSRVAVTKRKNMIMSVAAYDRFEGIKLCTD